MENSHGNWVKPPTSCTIEGTAVAIIVLSRATRPVVSIKAPRTGPRSDLNPIPSAADEGVVEVMEGDNRRGPVVFRCHDGQGRGGGWRPSRRGLRRSKKSCYRGSRPQEPPCDGVPDGKLPASRLRRGPQRGVEPEPRHRPADPPGEPGRAHPPPGPPGAGP